MAELAQTGQALDAVGSQCDGTSKSRAVEKLSRRDSRRSFKPSLAEFPHQLASRPRSIHSFVLVVASIIPYGLLAQQIGKID